MATLSKGKVFTNGELVTPATLHSLVDSGTVTNIVNADISNTAAIADSKLAQITTAGKVLPAAVAGTAVITTDSRLSDARTPTTHTHDDRYYTETETNTLLAGKQASGSYAAAAHAHAISDTTGLQTALDGKQASGSYAAASHTHDASAITAGTLSNALTTATAANTANAIVARDAGGDFLAGKINGLTVGKGGGSVNTNTALGVEALNVNSSSGIFNTAVGYNALKTNTVGLVNTATGTNALRLNTIGSYNTATGFQGLTQNTTGIQNTAHGAYASNYNITGSNNTSCGFGSLYTSNGDHNVAIGSYALHNLENASQSTAIGSLALQNNINYSASSGVGYNAQVTGSNQVQLGNSTATTYAYGAVQDRSDVRDKADIRDTTLGLEFVNALRPVDFKWDMREDYRPVAPQAPDQDASQEAKAAYQTAKAKWMEDVKLANITHDGSKKRGRYHHGLIAQEVKAVLDSKGIDFGGYQDHSIKGGDDVLSIGYEELIAPMLKAIQELAAEIAALKSGK